MAAPPARPVAGVLTTAPGGLEAAEVIVIDDASTDATAATLAKVAGLVLVSNAENQGFIRTCNRAIDIAILRLRRVIEDDPKQPRWIQTVWGIGFKLA